MAFSYTDKQLNELKLYSVNADYAERNGNNNE